MIEYIMYHVMCDKMSHYKGGHMDTLKCKALITALEHGSLSAAADELGYTPSGITRMVNSIEDELGIKIIKRSSKGIVLTDDGEKVIGGIMEIVRLSEHIRQISENVKGLETGSITIGTYFSISYSWLPKIIKKFTDDYPKISIDIVEAGNNDLYNLLNEGKVDCCFMGKREYDLEWIEIRQDDLVVWLPKNHKMASLEKIPLELLDKEAFIMSLPNKDNDVDRMFRIKGISPDVRYTTQSDYSSFSMVAAGLGISVNNSLTSENWSGDVLIKKLDPEQYTMLCIAVKSLKTVSPALKKFIEYVKEMMM